MPFAKQSPHLRVVFFRKTLSALSTAPFEAHETKTTEVTERRIKKNVGFTRGRETNETQLPQFKNPHQNKKEVKMKTRYRLAVWAVMAVVGSTIVGGGFWVWLTGIAVGKFVARLALTAVVAIAVYLLVYALIFGGMYWLLTI